MKKLSFLLMISLAVCKAALSQNVGISSNGATPAPSAMLDIVSTTSGLLIPRVVLTATNSASPVTSPATSLLVYNTATTGTAPNNVVPGYYYWTIGAAWAPLTPSTSSAWLPTGNSGTTAGTNFIGTTDAIDFVVKTNNTEKARFTSSGNFGIGANPTFTFDVNGTIRTGKAGPSGTNGSLVYSNSTNANTLTFNSGVTSATYGLTLPVAQGAANTALTNDGTGVLTWAPLSPSATTAWLPTGNSGTTAGTNFIGTTDAVDLVVKTSNAEQMRLFSTGGVAIGTTLQNVQSGTNPEKLLVTGTAASVNTIVGTGTNAAYLQLNIKNLSNGVAASSDVVATANNGDESSNYVDMGINSSTNTGAGGLMGVANDAYLYNLGQNFLMGTGTAAKSLVFMTGGTAQATNERMRIDGTGNVGVGTISPTFKFDVNGAINTGKASATNGSLTYSNSTNANTLTFNSGVTSATYALTLPTTQGTANTMMTNDGTGVLTWATPSAPGSAWLLGGNVNNPIKNFGTTNGRDLPIITSNLERMRISSAGGVGIGTSNFNNANPELLVVDAGTTTSTSGASTSSVNVIVGKGNYNNYLQLNIQNQSAGASASSDVVATADNGSEITNYVDMGINGSANTSGAMGSVDDAYLYNIGQNLLVGTGTAAKSLVFMTGGTSQATNERMRIDGTGNVGIANIAPSEKLDVTGNVRFSGALMPNNSAGTSGFLLTSAGAGAAPTWSNPGTALNSYSWALGGNSVIAPAKNLGTTTNVDLPFIANSAEQMRLFAAGGLAIGATALSGTNPEKLLVNAGSTSVNAVVGTGNNVNYLQLNIKNSNTGISASSDVVATADNGSETTNYVDMGINSSTNNGAGGLMGVANDAYLYNIGQNLLVGTGTAAKSLVFMTGGTSQAANERMRIDGSGNVGIGNNSPNSTLSITGSLAMKVVSSGAASYTILATDYVIINTAAGAVAWTNPAASSCAGRVYRLVNQGTGAITLTNAVTTANATSTPTVPAGGNFEIISDGTVWRKIN